MAKTGLAGRIWASFLLLGLMGQFAWTIENMYFNVFLYDTISTDPNYIAEMVAASAVVATLTTLLMGAWSDKVGRRKVFICTGFIIWGFTTGIFGFISVHNVSRWLPMFDAVAAAATLVVIMDCVMTFFGSTAYDSTFNAYVTDVTSNENRGRVESVLAVLPLVAMLVIFGFFDSMTQQGKWTEFFAIFGIMVSVAGVVAIFLVKDRKREPRKDSFFKNLIYGFRPSVMRQHPGLYLSMVAFCLFSISVQVFFPYLIIYIENYLKIKSYAILLGIVLIVASIVSVVGGNFIDRVGKIKFAIPAAVVMFAGLLGMFFVRQAVAVAIAGSIMMSGYMLVTASFSALIRDYTPVDKAGHFQGIRMIFAVMLPMIIGPYIGAAVIQSSKSTYVDLGVVKQVPTPGIFLASAIALIFLVIPVLLLRRCKQAEKQPAQKDGQAV